MANRKPKKVNYKKPKEIEPRIYFIGGFVVNEEDLLEEDRKKLRLGELHPKKFDLN